MLLHDLRYAVRTLVGNRGFAIVATLCLGLAIGINTMIYSVVDGILIQPLPYENPSQLVLLNETNQRAGIRQSGVSNANLRDWRERNQVFADLAGYQGRSLTLADTGDPERYRGAAISWNLFPLLGVKPALGRGFTRDDDRLGAEPVMIISDEIWHRRYQADPSIIGRRVLLNGAPRTLIAVMPPKFQFIESQQIWLPLDPFVHDQPRGSRNLAVFARLKPDASLDRARWDMDAVTARLSTDYPKENDGWGVRIRPIAEDFIPPNVRLVILTMMGAVTLVVIVACANLANLMLARAGARRREISIRAALGAGRLRIARQLLTEAVLLALASVPLGLVLARVGLDLLDRAMPPGQVPYYIHWELNVDVLVYSFVIAACTGVVFGLAPAVQAAKLNLTESLKEGGHGSTVGSRRARLRNSLVVAEVALSVVLLVGASLFVRSFLNLQNAQGGFDTAPLMTMRFFMSGESYTTDEPRARRVEDIVRRIEGLGGVQSAFASNLIPLGGGGDGGRVIVEGRTVPRAEEPSIGFTGVTSHFFRTLNVPLVSGRDFSDAEGQARVPVAVINQAMAKRVWPNENPIGRRFRLDREPVEWFSVIGISQNVRHGDISDEDPIGPNAYVPFPYGSFPNTGLTIRVAGEPAGITAAAREQIRASDAGLPVFEVRTMEEVRQLGFWEDRIFGWLFSIFAAVALLLAVIGVYGVLSYAVSQRTQEMGVRVALGAGRGDVLRLIVGQGVRLAAIGVAVGLVGSFAVTRVIRTLLFNVTPTDPGSFIGVSVFLVLIAALASYAPARRAIAVDPLIALRAQ
ncbi:MAG: ABC transporter permease [Acidobacteria bacterium]|nr:ABC transporter permease [Acidobacteriota bacterium]